MQTDPPQQQQPLTDSIAVATPASNIDWDKKIIKTATLKLEVKDFRSYSELAHRAVRQYEGYVAQEANDISEYQSGATISIKVPVHRFEDLLSSLTVADAKLLERKIATEDVTAQVIDTKARLEAKKQMRLKYMDFLKQSKNMKEVLEVQAEINEIQEEIEAASGRIGFLKQQSAYSTINLSFYQPLPGYTAPDKDPSFFDRVTTAFSGGTQLIKNLLVALIYIWPLILVILFVLLLLKRSRIAKGVSKLN